jgi:hypothetical protein
MIAISTPSPYQAFTKGLPLLAVQLTVDFILGTGDHWAFPYGHLIWLRFDASGTMLLTFAEHRVTLEGRNLGPLYAGILRHDVACVHEASSHHPDISERETVVEKIRVEARQES